MATEGHVTLVIGDVLVNLGVMSEREVEFAVDVPNAGIGYVVLVVPAPSSKLGAGPSSANDEEFLSLWFGCTFRVVSVVVVCVMPRFSAIANCR